LNGPFLWFADTRDEAQPERCRKIRVVGRKLPELLLVAFSAALGVVGFVHPHGAAMKVCAVVGAVAYLAAAALFLRRWVLAKLHARRHPELQPHEPNYNRTPYV
jgi:hypothetical protein